MSKLLQVSMIMEMCTTVIVYSMNNLLFISSFILYGYKIKGFRISFTLE